MYFEDVMERVATIVESELGAKPYDRDIAKALCIAPAQYSNNKKRGNIPFGKISEYCGRKMVSINWVLFEQGAKMLYADTSKVLKIHSLNEINSKDDPEDPQHFSLDRGYANMVGIKEGDEIGALSVMGDSMEPTFKDNSILLVDKTKIDISHGGIFALNINGGVFVRRVSLSLSGEVSLISDNKHYSTENIPASEVVIVGKIIGCLS